MNRSFPRRLTASYLFVVSITLLFSAWFLTPRLEQGFLNQMEQSMTAQTTLLSRLLYANGVDQTPEEWQSRTLELATELNCRITIIQPDGRVLADSERPLADIPLMENHRERPEIAQAIAGASGQSIRHSTTLNEDLLYVAIAARRDNRLLGIVRMAYPIQTVRLKVMRFQKNLTKSGAAALLVALVVALFSVRKINQPLKALVEMAEDVGQGRYDTPIRVESHDEFGHLARTLGDMASRVSGKISELAQEKSRLSTILQTLVEGVIAVDQGNRIMLVNPAVERLFGVRQADIQGRSFQESLRHSELTTLIEETLQSGAPISREITVHSPEEHRITAQSMPIAFTPGERGALVALYDITELRRLERVRQEFVANASHELKTPLTSIKGYVETLLDGALEDPQHNRAFLQTIQEQANRLTRLIEDLLDLSAIEGRKAAFHFQSVALAPVVSRLFEALQPHAKNQGVRLEHTIPENLPPIHADPEKLAQILMNLMENAIKFNRSGGFVRVEAEPNGDEVEIRVVDDGAGIAAEDLPRIFERFYRGDKSHSHDVPGTGLGLAIVKHLVEAHQGRITVKSSLEHGTFFHLHLPAA